MSILSVCQITYSASAFDSVVTALPLTEYVLISKCAWYFLYYSYGTVLYNNNHKPISSLKTLTVFSCLHRQQVTQLAFFKEVKPV